MTATQPRSEQQIENLRILVVDDRPLMRAGLASVLDDDPLIAEVLQAGSLESAYAVLASCEVDVIVVSPDRQDPVETNRRFCALASRAGRARVVCLYRDEALAPPTCGRFTMLPETAPAGRFLTIVDQSRPAPDSAVCADGDCGCQHTHLAPVTRLTAQESLVLAGLTDGLSNREIAVQLGLAEKTVKNYMTRIFTKLGVTSRTAAIAALRDGVDGALHH